MTLTFEEAKKIIGQVPAAERSMPALVIDETTYNWEEVLTEIGKKSQLAEKMLIEIEEMRKHGSED